MRNAPKNYIYVWPDVSALSVQELASLGAKVHHHLASVPRLLICLYSLLLSLTRSLAIRCDWTQTGSRSVSAGHHMLSEC